MIMVVTRVSWLIQFCALVTLLAILGGGGIAVPLAPAFPASELRYIIDQSQSKMLLATEKFQGKAEEVVREGLKSKPIQAPILKTVEGTDIGTVKLEDVGEGKSEGGMMLYTSGTTSRPVGDMGKTISQKLRLHANNFGRRAFCFHNPS